MKELGSRLSELPEAVQLIDGVCSLHHAVLPPISAWKKMWQWGWMLAWEHKPKKASVAGYEGHACHIQRGSLFSIAGEAGAEAEAEAGLCGGEVGIHGRKYVPTIHQGEDW